MVPKLVVFCGQSNHIPMTEHERATQIWEKAMKNPIPAFILLVCLASPALAAADPTGEWLVKDGTARIRINPCADALWGVIAWAQTPGTDQNNPNPALRNRPIIGMPILLRMKKVEPNRWEGEVYNAQNGKTYTSNISLVKTDVLRIEGCILGGLFCDGENWTRVTSMKDAPKPAPPKPGTNNGVCP
ncbi:MULTISPECIES: DUF2147 domain-containing protein [Rhodomicrobium]|uniref:DUF2147 domain-containing protein n=1 Tax=Rhodomicrobium TaxID=1068 RepID=UPI001FDA36D4|nr:MULTISPECIES: DUF2147 domain-containing protein [Rhodomicrobium]